MLFETPPPVPSALRAAIRDAYRIDEAVCVRRLLGALSFSPEVRERIESRAAGLVEHVRRKRTRTGGIDAFMHEYDLSSEEGIVLMCLAEALLRIPDDATADALIQDKIGGADWEKHLGTSENLSVNASTWGLMLSGRVVSLDLRKAADGESPVLGRLVQRLGEPVIRQAVRQAMRILGRQFVMGRTVEEALGRARSQEKQGYRYSYDMLGEAARTMDDAERYFDAYSGAITAIGKVAKGRGPISAPGISIKLSALHPRYEFVQADRVMSELLPRLAELCRLAAAQDIGLCIDAEEADRLDISLDIIKAIAEDPALDGWDGLGLAVQAYQKRGAPLVDWLTELAGRTNRRLMVRLTKGAYWDTEIKRSQESGVSGYPVFTRKASTDVAYLVCAQKLLAAGKAFYPCFATHNAHTLAAVLEMAGERRDYEFQRLHGMGESLYEQVVNDGPDGISCRIYAPVGSHEDLLAYLVRRLLENGANSSFVNRIADDQLPVARIVADPIEATRGATPLHHPGIPLPIEMFGKERRNSRGLDLTDLNETVPLKATLEEAERNGWSAAPIIGGKTLAGEARSVVSPADQERTIGKVVEAGPEQARQALDLAVTAQRGWDATPARERGAILRRAADLYESQRPALMALAIREAGKSIPDAIAELREAVDFLRYYAAQAERNFAGPQELPGPTGERNELSLHGRGVFLCISPWNFPLAIFTGQISAALAAGNAVLAKPAEQTPLIAAYAVGLLHKAGVPGDVLQLLPGDGPAIGDALLSDPRLGGVAFTGSTEVARLINRRLAERDGPIAPLIAETGGLNAMIVDSSALSEQVTRDVMISAFQSAGQRCSALRVLHVQEDVAERQIEMIAGAMRELRVGDPALLSTDVGPVIDKEAKEMLEAHCAKMGKQGRLIAKTPLGAASDSGLFVAPHAFEISGIEVLEREVFGPILHVVRYKARDLDAVIDRINATGYGLTLSVHSRSDSRIAQVVGRARVGNLYVNRNQIGAIVGVQPFGGEGLSGTGPKAGGPHYLTRFAGERTVSTDTTAAGGNASLMAMEA
jgi:RHH-type proline utilization regulon transcriptional repressor/proline dehydrogenase/delta 1-pyrroline-5-carboxylate dehydrogenase